MVTKSCKGKGCREPWGVLHPGGDVSSLAGALHKTFDAFYENQPRVSFNSCVKGHVVSEEGPQDVTPWSGGEAAAAGLDGRQGPLLPGTARRASFERSGRWSDWT
jgi:hypothetical protein